MIGWHHQLNGCESEQTPGDSEGQETLACRIPWGHKESDTTEQQLLFTVVSIPAIQVSQLYIYTQTLFLGFPSHLSHHRALSRVPCTIQLVLIS